MLSLKALLGAAYRFAAIVLLAASPLAMSVLAPIAATAQSPWGKDYFPNVSLTTETGKKVKFYDDVLKGKVLVVNFMFTKCGDVCPLDTAQLKKVSEILGDKMGKSIFFYSVSVDPANDTPAAMAEFKEKYQIGKGWTFLTGKIEDVTLIQQKFGLEPANGTPRAHSTTIILANEPSGQWIKRSPYENPQMLANLLAGHLNPRGMLMSETGPKQSYANAVAVPAGDAGEQLYRTRCASCHTIGGGDGLGPDLLMVTGKHTDAWMKRWLKEPDKMIAEGDPYATAQLKQFRDLAMPNLKLDDASIAQLIAFMDKESVTAMEGKQAAQHAHHH
jgi:cytochrome oxidase Cu insertion factor (SCO1/SenC/PrrC family)/cytochrome c2